MNEVGQRMSPRRTPPQKLLAAFSHAPPRPQPGGETVPKWSSTRTNDAAKAIRIAHKPKVKRVAERTSAVLLERTKLFWSTLWLFFDIATSSNLHVRGR